MGVWLIHVAVLSMPIALIGLYAIVCMALQERFGERQRIGFRAIFLVSLGVLAMVAHLQIDHGVYFDQRGAAIAVAALFGGPLVGGVTAAAEVIYRLFLGGAGMWAGVAGIVGDWLGVMLVLHVLKRVPPVKRRHLLALLLLGGAVGATEALSLLLISPYELGQGVFRGYGFGLFCMQVLSTLLLGGLLYLEESRVQALSLVEGRSEALRRSLHQVVGALSTAMMHRDPGTAGHEQRVADLAVAVGRELGWDEVRLEGLHLAAMVHDIGQIRIPSEILNRPRALMPQEFELVKMHAEAGYQILRDVEFPWPIAEIVYQHHENLDGSGYPRGLSGAELLPEARIIRVCDMLEAMLSHRPFRRACTQREVLEELQALAGRTLDAQIVAICVHLFEERGYVFVRAG